MLLHHLKFTGFSVSVPNEQNNGFIYAKIHGGLEKIRTAVFSVFLLKLISFLLNVKFLIGFKFARSAIWSQCQGF